MPDLAECGLLLIGFIAGHISLGLVMAVTEYRADRRRHTPKITGNRFVKSDTGILVGELFAKPRRVR
jgi:hypothetical protein